MEIIKSVTQPPPKKQKTAQGTKLQFVHLSLLENDSPYSLIDGIPSSNDKIRCLC